jgi:hypothetical protein
MLTDWPARLYHPDRNPGKEIEYVPKFQSIQAAHEILSDPEQRAKYDADRRKLGYGPGGQRTTAASGQTDFAKSPYATYSNWAPPPRRTARPTPRAPPQPPPQPSYASTSAYQARRPPNFPGPQRGPPPKVPPRAAPAEGANARANVFTAWQHMQGERVRKEQAQQQQHQARQQHEPAFSEDDRRGRAARDAANAHTQKPGLGRSNTTKTPKKPGFDPSDPDEGGWEPQATRTSAYSSYVHTPRHTPPKASSSGSMRPPFPPPPPPRSPMPPPPAPKSKPDSWSMDGNDSWSRGGDDDAPFTEGNERLSTPYSSHGGEKTYFDTDSLRRSASTHAAQKMGEPGSGARHRSASPAGRNKATNLSPPNSSTRRSNVPPVIPNNSKPRMTSGSGTAKSPFHFDYSSSSSEEGSSDPPQRQKAQPGRFWSGAKEPGRTYPGKFTSPPGTPLKSEEGEIHTAPETPVNGTTGDPQMYAKFLSKCDLPQNRSSSGKTGLFGSIERQATKAYKFPAWAIPSGVKPPKNKFSTRFTKSTSLPPVPAPINVLGRKSVSFVYPQALEAKPLLQPEHVANKLQSSRFTFSSAHAAPNLKQETKSAENVSTAFSAENWDGKFEGSKDFVPPPLSGRKNSKGRSSPTRRSTRFGNARNPIDLAADGFPPPPPNPPPLGNGVSFHEPQTPGAANSGPDPVKFSSEEWAETLKEAKFFYPNLESSRSTSPLKANAAATRRTKVGGRTRKQSKSEARPVPPAAFPSDASDEAESPIKTTYPQTSAPSGFSLDSDAMDIDSESPVANQSSPRTARGPRLVPVPPNRSEWRDNASAGNIPSAVPNAGGQVPAGTVPTAVPNAAVPMPPPPPRAKKTRGSAGITLNDLNNVTPFAASAEGLQNLSDLSGTLPFESAASSHPLKTYQPQQLELPAVPKAPGTLPAGIRITENQWRAYVGAMSFYMGTWYQFNDKMLLHFNTRHASARKFGTGLADQNATRLLQAMGETSNEEGLASYITGLEEDVRVRRHWDVAFEKHREAVEAFAAVKARVKTEGLVHEQ